MKVFVAIDEPNMLVYVVTYKTKWKKKVVNMVKVIKGHIYWSYK